MADSLPTRASLLLKIRDPHDDVAWRQFIEIYAPLIYGYGRKNGLQDADAADLAQDVLRTVAQTAQTFDYDPKRGAFRGWLFTVTRNKLRDFLASRARKARGSGDTRVKQLLEAQSDSNDQSQRWDLEYQQRLFVWASERIRGSFQDTTWRAFWLTSVDDRDVTSVAEELGISVGAVYVAKSRVLKKLREKVAQIDDG